MDRRSTECDINSHDEPTLLEYLNTPYENEKQAYEKLDKYFDNKSFFDYFTNFFYKIFKYYMSCSCVIIFRGRKGIDNKYADENLNKFFDFLFDTKIIETGIPDGTVYEVFKNEEIVCSVTNFVNEQLEVESQDNELRELLEYFVGVKVYHMEDLKELIHFDHHSDVYETISRSKKYLKKFGQGELYTINKNEEVIGSLESLTFYNLK